MIEGPVLGIDLGTTNSVVAITDGQHARVLADPEGNRLVPSCVSFTPEGQVLVGHAARERRLVDAENTVYSVKRLIGRPFTSPEVQRARERFAFTIEPSRTGGVQVKVRKGTYALPELSALVLRHLREVAEAALGVECKRAVITVPANFNELQRSATQAAGKVAGLEVLRIIHEPTAATLAYGYGRDKPETIAVYDFGGGTFDITVLDLDRDVFEVVSTAGDTFLGGDDIDLSIAEMMADACTKEHGYDVRGDLQAFERMRAAAEWAKCQLSSVPEAELTLEQLFTKPGGLMRRAETIDFTFRMTADELEARMRPLIARTFDVVADALREAGRRPREIDNVVLVGGSTRIPLVRRMVEEHFGRAPRADIDPDLVVAQGAAIHAWTLAGKPAASIAPGAPPGGRAALRKGTLVSGPRASELPKQPAFAPPPVSVPKPRLVPPPSALASRNVVVPSPASLARPDSMPAPSGDDPFARTSLELGQSSVAVLAPPARVGTTSDSGLLELDDPLARARTTTREGSIAARRPIEVAVPAPIDAPFAEPSARKMVAANVDAPFDLPETARKKPRRDATVPFGIGAPAAIDSPFGDEPASAPTRDALAEGIAALDAPLGLPEPAPLVRDPLDAGMFEVELESVPPEAPPVPPPPARLAPPPPPPPRRPPPPPPPSLPVLEIDEPPPIAIDEFALSPDDFASPPAQDPRLAPHVPELPIASAAPAPLLMDVTPLSLGLETAGGFCAPIVPRNAPVPAEKSRVFSTARDDQEAVELRICQGESTRFADNELLGTLVFDGIRKARRGAVRIDVSFLLDASGILDVRATDLDTGRAQHTRIHLQGGLDPNEIDEMRRRQERELA
ncbi:Hsp70 family protein [Sandaracinus amylolyticus]|uniref:Hsp70 family protein n=1 Tax=Sandaracinus amylolyticus TaxID=927083 RepID=UPI0022A7CC42|nr:Hsp70 family protein [Sandaracinus amylolyticus]UJR81100.1 Chaperone protein DnaK [Sandaracinus amylolyticus]